ncbi:hypothetical protein ASPSYDRAFT_40455 [Aspergillus sydowii CBS 593.65]|uniref:Uncharacterized protein n=1 Tax=Aspergillus sydowii CBS 593.65 TaxID=1036612 RepID=A0A1L9TR59_9EURO|nr:uncharacterized protein ASPSYDRAFT_40455 [Aspergillus sydowii CBS 593.65]OJJ61901.1 hypothetical protein ASPSYDRAFT_40455 [Aspergillus sydowii CBS 593.65]
MSPGEPDAWTGFTETFEVTVSLGANYVWFFGWRMCPRNLWVVEIIYNGSCTYFVCQLGPWGY